MGNRERLVHAAADFFQRQGYAATSVEDLLEDTGIARSNFYYHFDDKLDLARELLERWTNEFREELSRVPGRDAGSPSDRLRRMLRLLWTGEGGSSTLLQSPLGALALELAPHDEQIQALVSDFLDRIEERFRQLLLEASGPRAGRSGARPAAAPIARPNLVGALMMCHSFREDVPVERLEEGLLQALALELESGAAARGGRTAPSLAPSDDDETAEADEPAPLTPAI